MTGIEVAMLAAVLLVVMGSIDLLAESSRLSWWRAGAGRDVGPASGAGSGAASESGRRDRGERERRAGERRSRADPSVSLALVVSEVAARLRAGAPVVGAWRGAWQRVPRWGDLGPIDEGVPRGVTWLARRARWSDLIPGGSDDASDQGGGPAARPDRPTVREVIRDSSPRAASMRRAAAGLVAACRFTHRLGAPLADVLDTVADGIDESAAAEDARRVAGSGPRMSARILMALPLLGIVLGQSVGAKPLETFSDGGTGTLCLIVGVVCLLGGRLCATRMLRRAERGDREAIDPAVLCDLAVAGLESGASVPAVLAALGLASGLDDLGRIGRELTLGAPWAVAWDPCPDEAVPLGRALEPAWTDGTSPVPLLRRSAAQIRVHRLSEARARAEELGVRLVVPLGALLLPAFLALGVIPVLLHLGIDGFENLSP